MYTRRVAGKLINYQPVSGIMGKNSITIARDGNGKIETIAVTDGFVTKTMTFSYDGNGNLSGVATEITEN